MDVSSPAPDEERREVRIEFVGKKRTGEDDAGETLLVPSSLEEALAAVRKKIAAAGSKISYTIYYNGRFISRASVKGSGRTVENGDVFKIIPIMGGG